MMKGGTDWGDKGTREAKLKRDETQITKEEEIRRKKRSYGKNSPTFL